MRWPPATITLLGLPLHAALFNGRPGPVSEVVVVPPANGVRAGQEEPDQLKRFFEGVRNRSFDLAVQLHGGGRNSNPFLLSLGARHTVGTRTEDAAALERTIPYVYYQHEVFRALEVVGLAGAEPVTLEPQLIVTDQERATASEFLDGDAPLVTIHPGATDPRRRWPTSSFAALAAMAVRDGNQVLVVGDGDDAHLADEVARLAAPLPGSDAAGMRSVSGRLGVGELAALLQLSAVLVGNDSGPRHLAQAVGTPTVGLYWAGNVIAAGAMGRTLHRIHMSWMTTCATCGVDITQVGWTAERCEHNESLLQSIQPETVYPDVRELMATSLLLRGR